MRIELICLLLFILPFPLAEAQGAVPAFHHTIRQNTYTLLGRDPALGGSTTIPTVLVPVTLSFDTKETDGKPFVMDAAPDVSSLLHSPVFSNFAFPVGGATQYADAMLRATFPEASGWHTLLGQPQIKPVSITVPIGSGYILTSKNTGRSLAVVDVDFLEKEIFRQIPNQPGKLIIALTHNTTFYAAGDATVCCSWGTHGVDPATGNSFVLGSFLNNPPAPVEESDIQPLTQQLGEFINDPLHNPLVYGRNSQAPGNVFPRWLRPGEQHVCGGIGVATSYVLFEPTDLNPRSNVPRSSAFLVRTSGVTYHLQNVALLPWYTAASSAIYSFPDVRALLGPAQPCPSRPISAQEQPTIAAIPATGAPNGHKLIGYWVGHSPGGALFPLRQVSPQWDVVIVAFATPDHNAPEGTMQFHTPAGYSAEQFKSDIAYLKGRGKQVMISLGGGGEYFTLADPSNIPNFVSSVTRIVAEYGFDGIDLDFETPSLVLQPGDTDFRHPTTPSIVNLIAGLRQLRGHFGPHFLISLVPEGPQIPAGYPSYGGQFGSYLPLAYAIRDILTFIDVQDYNTPPLEALDDEIYQLGSVDYHAAMTELLLHGFNVAGDPDHFSPHCHPTRSPLVSSLAKLRPPS